MKKINVNELEEIAQGAKFERELGTATITVSYTDCYHSEENTIVIYQDGTISIGEDYDTFSEFIEVVYSAESDDEEQNQVQRETAAKVIAILFDIFEVEDMSIDVIADTESKKELCDTLIKDARWYLENGF